MRILTLFLLLVALPILAAEPVEISVKSGQRKVLFDLLRLEVAREAGMVEGDIKFEGHLKKLGQWAFFGGRSLNDKSQSLKFGPLGNDDTCALFLETKKGWALVDWSVGHSDAFYFDWVSFYGVKPPLLGLPTDWKAD